MRSCVAAVAPSTEIWTHCDGKRRQPIGSGVVDAASVGLELERDAGIGENLEDFPAVGRAQRLAATESRVGNAGVARCAGQMPAPRRA